MQQTEGVHTRISKRLIILATVFIVAAIIAVIVLAIILRGGRLYNNLYVPLASGREPVTYDSVMGLVDKNGFSVFPNNEGQNWVIHIYENQEKESDSLTVTFESPIGSNSPNYITYMGYENEKNGRMAEFFNDETSDYRIVGLHASKDVNGVDEQTKFLFGFEVVKNSL